MHADDDETEQETEPEEVQEGRRSVFVANQPASRRKEECPHCGVGWFTEETFHHVPHIWTNQGQQFPKESNTVIDKLADVHKLMGDPGHGAYIRNIDSYWGRLSL